jgi:hypothetical protein
MGTAAAPLTTYNAAGLAEDIHDLVSLLSPADTPVYSMIRQETAEAVVVSWQMDELRAPKNNAVAEGGAAPTSDQSTTAILQNYTQLFDELASVSSSVASSRTIGRANEMDYQVMKRSKEVKRDIERAIVGIHNDKVVAGGTREFASLSYQVTTGATGQLYGADTNRALGGIARDLSEALVVLAHQEMYTAGADPNWLLVSPVDAGKVANFAYIDPTGGGDTRTRTTAEGTLYNKVETYISPWGTLSVVTDRFCAGAVQTAVPAAPVNGDGFAFLLNTDQIFCATLQPFQSVPLAKVGHYEREMVFVELTVGVENTKSNAVIGDLNIS